MRKKLHEESWLLYTEVIKARFKNDYASNIKEAIK